MNLNKAMFPLKKKFFALIGIEADVFCSNSQLRFTNDFKTNIWYYFVLFLFVGYFRDPFIRNPIIQDYSICTGAYLFRSIFSYNVFITSHVPLCKNFYNVIAVWSSCIA